MDEGQLYQKNNIHQTLFNKKYSISSKIRNINLRQQMLFSSVSLHISCIASKNVVRYNGETF